jgi:hypothetical protein
MIDIKNIYSTLIEPNIQLIIILGFFSLLVIQQLDTITLLLFLVILFIIVFHKNIFSTLNELNQNDTTKEKLIDGNKKVKKNINPDDTINTLLVQLKKYKKYNKISYKEGYKYIQLFVYTLHDLEKDTIKHPKHSFENAELYLKQGLNSFQSLSISVPEDTYINSLKYNDMEPHKLSSQIGKLCKELQQHCYYLLYNLSLRINKDFIENPDIYKKEITFNTDNVTESNTFMKYELY